MSRDHDPNAVFDRHADDYSEEIDKSLNKYGVDHDFFTGHKQKLIANVLASYGLNAKEMTLLDVGCGVGKIHSGLRSVFGRIIGVDLSEPSIEVAKRANPDVTYAAYDGEHLPYEDNSVDMTLAICVVHHVPVPLWPNFVAQMMRVLRPGGIAMVIEHNPFNPVTRRIVSTCPLDEDATLIRARKLEALFKAADARDVRSRKILSVPPRNDALMKIDHVLGLLPFGAQYYLTARKA